MEAVAQPTSNTDVIMEDANVTEDDLYTQMKELEKELEFLNI